MKRLTNPLRAIVLALSVVSAASALANTKQEQIAGEIQVGVSYQNDTSLPIYYLPEWKDGESEDAREAAENPKLPNHHVDSVDPVVQHAVLSPAAQMPLPILNFDGMPNGCGCAPPDTDGEVGETQYVQMTNAGYQVFNKATGASVLGPVASSSIWAGFGGVCETNGHGDPVVLYDQIAKRWLISQFASATSNITDECIAVSTTSDATGSYNRYGFHLGSNFFDYPHLGMWPDGYYMSMNVFNAAGTAFLGPQAFAFDRVAMLAGTPGAIFVTPGITGGASEDSFLPADLDGSALPPVGAPNPFVEFPGAGTYKTWRFHADFATPANSTFTLAGSPAAAGFTVLCGASRQCVPQIGNVAADRLDGIGDRLMFRLAYRNFGDHEALVGNFSASAASVAGLRWFELRSATSGTPTVFQESTYQPDTDWRWMGSAAMDTNGNLAIAYSASSPTINPQLRYAGRLVGDPLSTLPQAEVHLLDGAGHQTGTSSRWGDYSDLTVDPVDDCTFWFTSEYYATTGSFGWKTRIGSFKFPSCSQAPGFSLSPTPGSTSVCAGTPALYTVAVGSVSGYNSPVTLALGGNPAASVGTFLPNPVLTLPGSSNLSVATVGVATGNYTMSINGTGVGAANQSASIGMNVFAAVPGAPTLITPANAAPGQSLRPTFTWSGSNTESYKIDIATDNAFASIVLTQTLTGTTFTPSVDLAPNTTFFWRVTPTNACGAGAVSATFSFTTSNLICRSPALAIPDNVPAGVNDVLTVVDPSGATLTDLKLTIKTTHTWVGDLKYTLSRTVGSTIVIDRPGVPASTNGCSSDNIDVTIDDTAATLVENQCNATPPALSGLVKPNNPLATPFNGQALAGGWTLNVSDNAGIDTGTLTQWCLVPTTTGGITYTLTYTAGANGSITGTTPQTVNAGANGTPVTAVPNANYHFVQWSDASTQNPRTDTNVAANISVTATFAIDTFTVTPSVTGSGAIAPNTPQIVNGGTTTAFTLTPNASNHIVNVTGTCGGTLVGNTFTTAAVTANCTVIANFALNVLVFTTQPADVSRGQALGTIVATEQDGSGNTIIDNTSSVDFTILACSGSVDLGSVAMVNGVATLVSSQRFYTVASGLQISASTGMFSGASQAFNVVADANYVFADGYEGCRL